jgi:hypothetical protein
MPVLSGNGLFDRGLAEARVDAHVDGRRVSQ